MKPLICLIAFVLAGCLEMNDSPPMQVDTQTRDIYIDGDAGYCE